MPVKLTTTIANISSMSNSTNRTLYPKWIKQNIGGVLVAGIGPSTITSKVMNLILNLIHQEDIKGPMSQSLVTLARHAKGFSDIRELGTKIYYDWKIGGSKNDTAVMVLQGSNDTNNEILKIASVATHRNPSLFMPTQWYSIR